MLRARTGSLLFVTIVVASVACGGDDDGPSPCVGAAQVAKDCNDKEKSELYVFDEAKCEAAGDSGKKIANCINDHSSNCDCITACDQKQTCP